MERKSLSPSLASSPLDCIRMTSSRSRGEKLDCVFLEMTKHDANVIQHLYAEASYSSPNTVNFWRKIIYAWLLDHDTIKFSCDDIQGMHAAPLSFQVAVSELRWREVLHHHLIVPTPCIPNTSYIYPSHSLPCIYPLPAILSHFKRFVVTTTWYLHHLYIHCMKC